MKKLIFTIPILVFCSFLFMSLSGWNKFPSQGRPTSITNYYYYQGQPFFLQLKPDMLFIKLNKELSEIQFKNLVSEYGNLSLTPFSSYVPADKRYFISLKSTITSDKLDETISELVNLTDVQYVSPVFSPDNGTTLIGAEDEIIVQFKPIYSVSQVSEFLSARNLSIVQQMDLSGGLTYVLRIPKNSYSIDIANEIYLSGFANYSEPNLLFTNLLCYEPNDPYYPQQWSLKNLGNNIPGGITGTADCDMDVDSAWNTTLGITQCRIAISDTGCDTLHEDLAANMVIGSGWNFWNNTPGAWDDQNHGTACAGISAAIGNNSLGVSGVAPNCKIIPVKWMSSSGSGNYTGASNATIWAYQKGAWVISNSWGFVGGASSTLDNAILDAVTLGRSGKGSIFVVASGNENGSMRFPASTNPNCLVVGGISPCNQRKSPSSCDLEGWGASYGSNLDVVAPCVKIYTTDRTGSVGYSSGNYFATFNGTSSATPNVAGVCALAFSVDSTMRWDTLRVRVARTCEKRGSYTYDQPGPRGIGQWNNEMGYGLVNARLLLASLGPPPPPLTNDIAVGPFLSFPSQFIVNTAYTIRTKVSNLGTANQTNVPIRWFINNTLTNTTNINLNSSAVDSVSNSWTPLATGSYTLMYVSALATDQNRNNDTVRTTVTVLPSVPQVQTTTICRNGLNKNITDYSTIRDTINFSNANAISVLDVNVKVDTVTHTWDGDLQFTLNHLSTTVALITSRGGSGNNFINTRLNDSAANPISSGTAPFNGEYRPESPLSAYNTSNPNGTWILSISDNAGGDTGYLKAWCITLTYQIITGGIETIEIPNYYSLSQNYPNPFNPVTNIRFTLPRAEHVKLTVYDVLGREVKILINEFRNVGVYNINFDASGLASGIYFYRIETANFTDVKKMMVVK